MVPSSSFTTTAITAMAVLILPFQQDVSLVASFSPPKIVAPHHPFTKPRIGKARSSSSSSSLLGASSSEEDLELTIQIIMQHTEKMARASGAEVIEEETVVEEETVAVEEEKVIEEEKEEETVVAEEKAEAEEEESLPKTPPRTIPDQPENDLMIRAALGETVEKTPLWLFRQAGRHLPEYKAYKDETGRNFLELLAFPDSVAECTMQPLRRYDVDAAILFSDILVIAEALGIDVTMPGGVGIQVPNPLAGPDEVASRIPPVEDMTKEFVHDKLGHVMEAVKQIRAIMAEENKSIPLIGFSAAPWTLLFYMVGGSSKKNQEIGKTWLNEHPGESLVLLKTLTKIVIEYMSEQIESGAHMLQVFEAMGMMIDEDNFYKYAMPCLQEIATELKQRYPSVPLMVFARGACFANEELSKIGYDVVSIDGSVDRSTCRQVVGDRVSLQGNYDPRELIENEDGTKTTETVRQTAKHMLEELGPQKLIANLGEGLGGKESPALVKAFVDAIHEESATMIKEEEAAAATA